MTFDFENYFDEPINIDNGNFRQEYLYNKLFYFSQIHEYILAGLTYTNCEIYLIYFYSNFTIKYKGLINLFNDCYSPKTFSLIFYENKYSIVIDSINNGNSRILIDKIDEIGTNL